MIHTIVCLLFINISADAVQSTASSLTFPHTHRVKEEYYFRAKKCVSFSLNSQIEQRCVPNIAIEWTLTLNLWHLAMKNRK